MFLLRNRKNSPQSILKSSVIINVTLTLLHSEQPKLYGVLTILSAIGLNIISKSIFASKCKLPDEFSNVVSDTKFYRASA